MKSLKRLSAIFTPGALAWIMPFLLIIPNLALAFTESDPLLAKLTDIILPLGVYMLLASLTTSVGITVLFAIPLIFFAGFQIVLLHLYGESIMAVDMFLNIATTNSKEASELLSNLIFALILVVIIYFPTLTLGLICLVRRRCCSVADIRLIRRCGFVLFSVGIMLLIVSSLALPRFSVRRNIFPVNVIANMIEAVHRTIDTTHYVSTSAPYTFSPVLTHDRDMREVYVIVIGETSRADNWQLFGYDRPTNPRLSTRDGLIVFDKTLSECNTTYKSVPMLLSPLTAENFGDSIYYTKGICSAFNEAGFNTAFISNQQRNHSFIDFFANQAQTTEFIRDSEPSALDDRLVDRLIDFIDRSPADKIFVVLHAYGSHFNYHERYNDAFRVFTPDRASEASTENRQELLNAYDNSIVYTDYVLDRVISSLDSLAVPAALIYTSDHGEDIFDDDRGRFLHSSPTTTFTQIHVPFLVWFSASYRDSFPDIFANTVANSSADVSSTRSVFPSMMSIAGIDSPRVRPSDDLTSSQYRELPRRYLNDYNEPVNLRQAGFKPVDFRNAENYN
ncbi:MAG: lipid A phosphoethanolamine transferase, partial [Muribaculaceae bacterium]|nr:lipid A phosphoethanolamine transferase [Muribaculaceae bacterium]